MRGLIVREPWASLIVDGKKTWEVRRTRTKHRGPVAIISGGKIIGIVDIVDVIELPVKEMAAFVEKHYADPTIILSYGADRETLFAWVLKNPQRLRTPIPIDIPVGAQVWVRIPEDVEAKVWKSLEG